MKSKVLKPQMNTDAHRFRENPKSKASNPKQIQNPKFQMKSKVQMSFWAIAKNPMRFFTPSWFRMTTLLSIFWHSSIWHSFVIWILKFLDFVFISVHLWLIYLFAIFI